MSEAQQTQAREELEQQIQLAQECKFLLSRPGLAASLRHLEALCFQSIDRLEFADSIGRDRLCLTIAVVRRIPVLLQTWADEGELSLKRLQQIMELKTEGEDE